MNGSRLPLQALPIDRMARQLTARQRFVLRGLIAGRSNQDMADQLHLTDYTIKYHCRALYNRFGVANRAELVGELLKCYGAELLVFAQTEEPVEVGSLTYRRVKEPCPGLYRPAAADLASARARSFQAHPRFQGRRL